jgi:spermidine/putrescine-binding protein
MSMTISRRTLLAAGAAAIAAPATIGRATVSTASAAFEGEGLIVVSWSGNHELSFREAVIDPFNEKFGPNWEALDTRMKKTIATTTEG